MQNRGWILAMISLTGLTMSPCISAGAIPPLLTVSCASLLQSLHQDPQTQIAQVAHQVAHHPAFQALRSWRRQFTSVGGPNDKRTQSVLKSIDALERDLEELRKAPQDLNTEFALRTLEGRERIQTWWAQRQKLDAEMARTPLSHRSLYRKTLGISGVILPGIVLGDIAGRIQALFSRAGNQIAPTDLASLLFVASAGGYFFHRMGAWLTQRAWQKFDEQSQNAARAIQADLSLEAVQSIRQKQPLSGTERESLHWAAVHHAFLRALQKQFGLGDPLVRIRVVELLERDTEAANWRLHQVVSYQVTRDPPPSRGDGKRLSTLEPAPLKTPR